MNCHVSWDTLYLKFFFYLGTIDTAPGGVVGVHVGELQQERVNLKRLLFDMVFLFDQFKQRKLMTTQCKAGSILDDFYKIY